MQAAVLVPLLVAGYALTGADGHPGAVAWTLQVAVVPSVMACFLAVSPRLGRRRGAAALGAGAGLVLSAGSAILLLLLNVPTFAPPCTADDCGLGEFFIWSGLATTGAVIAVLAGLLCALDRRESPATVHTR